MGNADGDLARLETTRRQAVATEQNPLGALAERVAALPRVIGKVENPKPERSPRPVTGRPPRRPPQRLRDRPSGRTRTSAGRLARIARCAAVASVCVAASVVQAEAEQVEDVRSQVVAPSLVKPPKAKARVAITERVVEEKQPVFVERPRSPAAIASTIRTVASATADNTALLIGVDHAPGSRPLEGAVTDVRTMRTLLLRSGYKSANIKVLTDQGATHSAILGALDSFAARTSGKGTAVFHVTTHSGMSGGDMTLASGGGGRVARYEVAARLAKVRGHLWSTFGTCYAGAYAVPGIVGPDRIAVFSSSAGEYSYQNAAGTVTVVYMVQRAMLEHHIKPVEDAYAWAVNELNRRKAPEKAPILNDGIAGDVIPGPMPS